MLNRIPLLIILLLIGDVGSRLESCSLCDFLNIYTEEGLFEMLLSISFEKNIFNPDLIG